MNIKQIRINFIYIWISIVYIFMGVGAQAFASGRQQTYDVQWNAQKRSQKCEIMVTLRMVGNEPIIAYEATFDSQAQKDAYAIAFAQEYSIEKFIVSFDVFDGEKPSVLKHVRLYGYWEKSVGHNNQLLDSVIFVVTHIL